MNEALQKIRETTEEIHRLSQEMKDREASAQEHEKAAREDRAVRTQLKKEIEALSDALRHQQVIAAVDASAMAAKKAQEEAETAKGEASATLDRLQAREREMEEKMKQVDETLSRLNAAKEEQAQLPPPEDRPVLATAPVEGKPVATPSRNR